MSEVTTVEPPKAPSSWPDTLTKEPTIDIHASGGPPEPDKDVMTDKSLAPETKLPELMEFQKPTTEQRVTEIGMVGETAVEGHIKRAVAETARNPDKAGASPFADTINALRNPDIRKVNSGDAQATEFRKIVDGVKARDKDGRPQDLSKIVRADETYYVCQNKMGQEVAIPRGEVATAYMVKNRDAFTAGMQPDQQKAAKLHLDIEEMKIQGKTPDEIKAFVEKQDPDALDAAIVGGVGDMGGITTEKLRTLIVNASGATGPDATAEKINMANGFLSRFDGTNVVDPRVFREVVQDFAPEQLKVNRDEVKTLIESYRKELAGELTPTLREKYMHDMDEARAKLEIIDDLQRNAKSEGGDFGNYLDQYMNGEVDPDVARLMRDAINSGDMNKVVDVAADIQTRARDKMTAEEAERHDQMVKAQREYRKKMLLKGGAGVIGLLLFLAYNSVSKSGGQGH